MLDVNCLPSADRGDVLSSLPADIFCDIEQLETLNESRNLSFEILFYEVQIHQQHFCRLICGRSLHAAKGCGRQRLKKRTET